MNWICLWKCVFNDKSRHRWNSLGTVSYCSIMQEVWASVFIFAEREPFSREAADEEEISQSKPVTHSSHGSFFHVLSWKLRRFSHSGAGSECESSLSPQTKRLLLKNSQEIFSVCGSFWGPKVLKGHEKTVEILFICLVSLGFNLHYKVDILNCTLWFLILPDLISVFSV